MEHPAAPQNRVSNHVPDGCPDQCPDPWVIIPLLIIFWAGELIWREREAGLSEIADAAPVPEWVALPGQVPGLESRSRRVDGVPDGGRGARSGAHGLSTISRSGCT